MVNRSVKEPLVEHSHYSTEHSFSDIKGKFWGRSCTLQTPQDSFSSHSEGILNEHSRGYSPDRFLDLVHPYFFCGVCEQVVCDPLECKTCRNVLCAGCALTIETCPYGCPKLKFIELNPFVAEHYHDLLLKCQFVGCNCVLPLSQINPHEATCLYKQQTCQSPICQQPALSGSDYCSATCELVTKFYMNTKGWPRKAMLVEFKQSIQDARQQLYKEARGLLAKEYNEVDSMVKSIMLARMRKQELTDEVKRLRVVE